MDYVAVGIHIIKLNNSEGEREVCEGWGGE